MQEIVVRPGKTIFWADDDPDDLEVFRELMQEIAPSYQLIEFHNGLDLIENLRKISAPQYPCLIVLDMNMPVLNGRDTLAILKADESLKEIPVVVFTTSQSALDKKFCAHFKTEMITKPPVYDHLIDIIRSFVSGY